MRGEMYLEKLIYALNGENLVCVEDVSSGLKCNCVCPACKQPLVAKKGKIKTHHFAHASLVDCQYGYETSLHLLAKDILKETKNFMLPDVLFGRYYPVVISKKTLIEIKNVQLEQYIKNVKPDIIIEDINGNKYCIEIFVTHAIDEEKLQKITEANLNTIEIDLSKINRLINRDELKEILLNDNNLKRWIYHSKTKEAEKVFGIPTEKLRYCSIQWANKPNASYCMTCGYSIDISKDNSIVYCRRAKEVLSAYRMPLRKFQPNACKKCGHQMDIDYDLDGPYYKCTETPNCLYTERIAPISNQTIEQFTQTCPLCGSKLVLRGGYSIIYKRYNRFWGCSNYPNCTFTKKY